LKMEERVRVFSYIILAVFALFILRLWDLQVVKGRWYREISERNRLRSIAIPAQRGIIYDRNHVPLVDNEPSFDIAIIREDFSDDPERLSLLAGLLDLSPEEIEKRLKDGTGSPLSPVKIKQDVSFKEVAMIEARRMDLPGLVVEVVPRRNYIYGRLASHVIGYLGYMTPRQLRDPAYNDVPVTAFVGHYGIEKTYDSLLRGKAGRRIVEVDATGRVVRIVGIQRPVKGRDITLTLDIDVQREAEEGLRGRAGAVVVLAPETGEVLAMASAPSFDPNLFARGISYRDWRRLINDPRRPLLNRAIQGVYPPGSTFKIIGALAALEEGVIDSATEFTCRGAIEMGGRSFRCWKEKGHGRISLYRAITESCDVYFYEIGKRLGIERIAEYARMFGLGEPSGIELDGERRGIVPSMEWKLKNLHERWYGGETLNTVIGQGYLSATPLQMARMVSAVINGGRLYRVHLLRDRPIELERTIEIDPGSESFLKRALIGVVEDSNGTGRKAHSGWVRIGGKTGTAQVVKKGQRGVRSKRNRDHAWFVAFAPEDEPEVAVSVFVEHGGQGGTAAAPIARDVIEAYFRADGSGLRADKEVMERSL
jgi:penicillin-binding protein 2